MNSCKAWFSFAHFFKVTKNPSQTRFKRILAHAWQKTKLKLNGAYRNFWKLTFNHSITHNSASQHRIATGGLSKCAEEDCTSRKLIQFWNTLSFFDIFDYVYKCKDALLAQFNTRSVYCFCVRFHDWVAMKKCVSWLCVKKKYVCLICWSLSTY